MSYTLTILTSHIYRNSICYRLHNSEMQLTNTQSNLEPGHIYLDKTDGTSSTLPFCCDEVLKHLTLLYH